MLRLALVADSEYTFMMKRLSTVFFLVVVLMLSAQAPPILADQQIDDSDLFILLAQGNKKLTESEAAKRAQEQYGGKVVGVTCREQDDRVYCSVRLDIDGRIKTVTIRG
jgi:uncharacterized membrane protein YkoI